MQRLRIPSVLKRGGMIAAILLTMNVYVTAADPETPRVALPLMKTPPTINGVIDEAEWSGAARMIGFVSQHTGALAPREGIFWVGCDGKKLYIAVKTETPPGAELLNRAVPDGDRDIVAGLHDDSIELWIDPHKTKTSGDRRCFQIITNGRGAIFDRSYDPANRQNPVDVNWRVKWDFANQVKDSWWHVEIAIPLSILGADKTDLDRPWGLRVVRDWQRGWDQSRWESVRTAFADRPSMPVVSWNRKAPVTQMISLHEQHKKPAISLLLINPHNEPLTLKASIRDAWSMNPPKTFEQTLTLAAGARQTVTLNAPDMGPEGLHHTLIRVASPDGKTEYYVREFKWKLRRPKDLWTISKEERRTVDLQFKYYPYYKKIKVKVNIESLSTRDKVTGVTVSVRKSKQKEALAQRSFKFDGFEAESVFDLPDLENGDYEVVARLEGGAGVPSGEVTKSFERRRFEWEHNRLGLSGVVIPPFSPLRVSGKTISCVLRDYTANDVGLWDQVRSDGRTLLARPMRWEVIQNGKTLRVKPRPGGLKVVTKPNQLITGAGWNAGRLTAGVTSEYDYDGMVKLTLRLESDEQSQIDRLSLIIPLKNEATRYMHACGDGLRHNYAGAIPAGEGKIWDSSRGNRVNIIGTFYPYLWLGGGARGLCWFADTDRNWILDDKTPTIELIRTGDVLEMRIHFITRAARLTRVHYIVFGLQATPVKPMPEAPVNWRKWQCAKRFNGCLSFGILGATLYYGCLSYDFYPRDGDLSIYKWISDARDAGKADEGFIKRWMEGYKPYAKPGSAGWKKFDAHIRYTSRNAPLYPRDGKSFYMPYTNARGVGFHLKEWQTFQDEWVNFAYFNRAKSGGLAYDITPTRSFQDCALWYYKKMMTCFDGIYWDNIFMAANSDTVVGNAWVDERGRTHPGMGLFSMRELIKRTAVMFHEEGRRGIFIPHMTNTNIVPILAFANVNLDWEWRYGQTDFQDRFPPDLTVAETIGRKTGNVPLILSGGFRDAKAPNWNWVMRTRLGVMLVHEIRAWDYRPQFEKDMWRKLYQFGYGEKDCRVYNYWDDGHPVSVDGIDGKTLVLSRGPRCIVVVTDYGEGGDCRLKLDLKALNLPPNVAGNDVETGETIETIGQGVFGFALKKHDFKAVLVE